MQWPDALRMRELAVFSLPVKNLTSVICLNRLTYIPTVTNVSSSKNVFIKVYKIFMFTDFYIWA